MGISLLKMSGLSKFLKQGGLAAGAVLGLGAVLYLFLLDPVGGRGGCNVTAETLRVVVKETLMAPPCTVIVKATRVVKDSAAQRQVDSLIATTADKDSLIDELTDMAQADFRFATDSPNGISVAGQVAITYQPLMGEFGCIVELDTIAYPRETITITNTVVVDRVSPTAVAISIFAGALVGTAATIFVIGN